LKLGSVFQNVFLNETLENSPEFSQFPGRCLQLSIQILVCRVIFFNCFVEFKGRIDSWS
jgi:hypothetical protein